MENRVAENLSERRVAHHVLAENADDPLSEKNRCLKGLASNGIDDEEPDCDRGCADETGDHAFTQKVVRPLSHWLLCSGPVSLASEKIPNLGVYSKRGADARAQAGNWSMTLPRRDLAPFSP